MKRSPQPQTVAPAAIEVAEPTRVDITTDVAASAHLAALLQRGEIDDAAHYLGGSTFFASADTIFRLAGGNERKVSPGGTPVSAGSYALTRMHVTNRVWRDGKQVFACPEYLLDGVEHHFDRARTPVNRLNEDERGRYVLRHLDMMMCFCDAIALVVSRDLRIESSDVSAEMRAHIDAHASVNQRPHFAWLEGT